MTARTLAEEYVNTDEGMRLYQQERAILEVTELACGLMERESVTRSELARRLRKTKGHVSQLLDGERNMTIRTMSDIFAALGYSIHFREGRLSIQDDRMREILVLSGADWHRPPERWTDRVFGIKPPDTAGLRLAV